MARNSLEHAFIDGPSLWQDSREFVQIAAGIEASGGLMSTDCDTAIAGSARAELQRRHELQFLQFEALYAQLALPGSARSRGG